MSTRFICENCGFSGIVADPYPRQCPQCGFAGETLTFPLMPRPDGQLARRLGCFAVLVVLIAALGWCLLPFVWHPTGTAIITVSGQEGTRFKGWCEVDGNRRDLDGVVPDTLTFQGHIVVFSITPDSNGTLGEVKVLDADGSGSVTSPRVAGHGVHGWLKFARAFLPRVTQSHIENFDPKEGTEKWSNGPP